MTDTVAQTGGLWDDIVPQVDPDRCRRCADCPPVAACPALGLRRDRPGMVGVPVADQDLCFGCYTCVAACPYGAIVPPRKR